MRRTQLFSLGFGMTLVAGAALGCGGDITISTGGGAGAGGQAGQGGAAGGSGGEGGNAGSAGAGGVAGAAGAGGVAGQGGQGAQAGQGGQGGDPCALCTGPGELCVAGQCVVDCTDPASNPCDPGTVCNVSEAAPKACVPEDDPCVIAGPAVACGAAACGAGTECDPFTNGGMCKPALPCLGLSVKGGVAYGELCLCTRPPPSCAAADLAALNVPGFVTGLVDLDFDLQCGAWGVTVISGSDYLRQVKPDGTLTTTAGVANLNMGEVAAPQGSMGTFGGDAVEVALTYNCCAGCGCQANPPQGVAYFDQVAGTLPMILPALGVTQGPGPFGSNYLDTGPQGLALGLLDDVFVGNVAMNGDVHRVSLLDQMDTVIATLPSRVYAATSYDSDRLLVATADGTVHVLQVTTGEVGTWAQGLDNVTSLQRDPFDGRVYVAFQGGAIHTFSSDGVDLGLFAQGAGSGRLSLARDNFLYFVKSTAIAAASVEKFALPAGL